METSIFYQFFWSMFLYYIYDNLRKVLASVTVAFTHYKLHKHWLLGNYEVDN